MMLAGFRVDFFALTARFSEQGVTLRACLVLIKKLDHYKHVACY